MQLHRRTLLAGVAGAALAPAARAQDGWPARPVRVIVPFSAGSTPDATARATTEPLRNALGQPFVVENRLGANGTIGMAQVARATDGHTLGVFTNGVATASALYPELPFDPARDFRFLSLLTRAPQILVVRPGVAVHDFAGFLAYAGANPGRLSFGSVGIGATSHLAMEELEELYRVDLVHVPYAGLPPAKLDLLAGRIDVLLVTAASVLPEIRAGNARPIAIAASRRYGLLPEVPTFAEVGATDMESYAWNGLVAPSALPAAAATRLVSAARAAFAEPAVRGAMEGAGFEVVASSPEEFSQIVKAETERWGGLVRRLGLRAG